MKITTISYMERKNKGNYEYEEMSASANLDEGESFTDAMTALKNAVHNALHGIPSKEIIKEEESVEVVAVVPAAKEKKTKAKKEKVTEVVEAEVAPSETAEESAKKSPPKPSKVVPYSSSIPEHKSILGGHLAKKYGDAWKTVKAKEEIKEFTASLNGKDFLNENGGIVESFYSALEGFFGA